MAPPQILKLQRYTIYRAPKFSQTLREKNCLNVKVMHETVWLISYKFFLTKTELLLTTKVLANIASAFIYTVSLPY
jgi:hypothetical protein